MRASWLGGLSARFGDPREPRGLFGGLLDGPTFFRLQGTRRAYPREVLFSLLLDTLLLHPLLRFALSFKPGAVKPLTSAMYLPAPSRLNLQ